MKYDITVVGAGPAGSTVAKFLSEKGFKVLLIDKSKFPRDKPCGGGLPIRVLKRFKYVKDKSLIESYSYGGFAYSYSLKYKAELQKNEPIVAMVLRKKFDFGLAKLAVDSGAVFSDGKAARDIKILKDRAKVVLDDGTSVDSKIVIGADGVWSVVAKKTGLRQRWNKFGMCILQEYNLDKDTLDRFFGKNRLCHIYTRFQKIAGYGWVFPKKEHLNIGIGEIGSYKNPSKMKTNLLDVYKKYIKTLKQSKIIPEDLDIGRYKGGALPVFPLEKTYADRVILVGDAGGFINPISGEGLYYAMSSGEIAAEVITESLENEETSEQFLSKYQVNWKKDIGMDIDLLCRLTRRQRREPTEKFIKLASRDKKLAELVLGIMIGQLSVQKYKWKIIRRYLYGSIRDLLIE
jgi:geranylgeranyl reductase family protein